MPKPLTMAKLRARIDRDPAAMEKLMRKLNRQKELVLETEDYKAPQGPGPFQTAGALVPGQELHHLSQ